MSQLPFVLLGLRASVREDSDTSPAELVLDPLYAFQDNFSPAYFRNLRRRRRNMPVNYHSVPKTHLPDSLMSATQVFVRVDAVKLPLSRPYEGPFRVLSADRKTFTVDKAGRPWTVSVDRLKRAFLHSDRPASLL